MGDKLNCLADSRKVFMKHFKDIDTDEFGNNTVERRRRKRMLGFSKTLEWPLPSFSDTYDIKIGSTKIGECYPSIEPYFNIIAGLSIDYGWDWFMSWLDSTSGHIGVEAGVDASIECTFGDSEINSDGHYDISLLSKDATITCSNENYISSVCSI